MSEPRIGLIQFPGSNCDQDCIHAFKNNYQIDLAPIWHLETSLPKLDAVILPGGFSYGDYLRGGALAARSPIVADLSHKAKQGLPIIGICNGFQILTEMKLLPGTLLANANQRFICQWVELETATGPSTYQQHCQGKSLRIPIAHGEGRYHIDAEGLERLRGEQQIVFRYRPESPNGAVDRIAGITDPSGRILGMMPHPERAMSELLGSTDGKSVFDAFLGSFL